MHLQPLTRWSNNHHRSIYAATIISVLLILLSERIATNAFTPLAPSPQTRNVISTAPVAVAASTMMEFDVESSSNKSKPLSSYTTEEIIQAQSNAEQHARSIHDNYSMNALFVNIPERSRPTPCTLSPESKGLLPADLPPGCLMRIGPNGATPDMGFLDGDGMVHCITLPPPPSRENDNEGGAAEIMYSSTYVQTMGRKLERLQRIQKIKAAAAKNDKNEKNDISNGDNNDDKKEEDITFSGTLGAAPQGLPMLASLVRNGLTFQTLQVQKDTCNTALACSGNRVLALMEQSPPSEIIITKNGKVKTIESACRLNGAVPDAPINGGSLGAHGRTDPKTGERVHVSYNSNARPFVRADTFGEDWELKKTIGVDIPAPTMVHDCALTENYVVVLDFPLTIRPRRFLANSFPVEYEPSHGARIGLVPRQQQQQQQQQKGGNMNSERNKDDTVWVDVESGVVLHAANAYEREDGTVVVHAFKSVPNRESSYIMDYTPAFLYEWILDPTTGKVVKERCLNPHVMVEFPAVEDSLVGREAQYTYGLVATSVGGPIFQFRTPQAGVLLDSVVKLAIEDDAEVGLEAGDVAGRFDLPQNWHFVSEPTVVTKTGGDGHYILMVATYVPPCNDKNGSSDHVKVATDGQSMKSQFLVLDGDDISAGPVTTVDLPHHVNYGLHSLFLEWDKMK